MSSLTTRRVALRWTDRLAPPILAISVSLGLFWIISRVIDTRAQRAADTPAIVAEIEMIVPPDEDVSDETLPALTVAPALPSPAGANQAAPDTRPAEAALPTSLLDTGKITVNTHLDSQTLGLGLGSSNFAGFGGRGTGGGGSGTGGGGGKPYSAKEIVPLSTARPQMPEWACKQGLRGWVEVSFTVTGDGHVRDVRLVDADPRGVFEGAAIDSVSHWIYQADGSLHEVRQRVEMLPEECAYNWK